MTFKTTALFFLALLCACAAPPAPEPAPLPTAAAAASFSEAAFFPVLIKSAPLVADLRVGPEMCMAWSGQFLPEAKKDFDWQFYYHSGTWRRPTDTAVPIVRARPGQREDIAEQLLYLKSIDWRGLVLLANEPDMPDQDAVTRPRDLAGLYWYATQVLPDATFVTPNTISLRYLDQFLDYAAMRPKDRIGLHIYQGTPWTAVHTWPAAWLRQAEEILAKHGIENPYWISETGFSEAWPMATSTRYATEILSSNAEVVCIYTTTCNGWLPGCGWDLYAPGGAFTTPGRALKTSLSSPLPTAAYP